MSQLDHDLMMDRLLGAPLGGSGQTQSEKELEKWQNEKQQLMIKQNREYLESLLKENASTPVKVGQVQVNNGHVFRELFLQAQLKPLLKSDLITLGKLCEGIDEVANNLRSLGVVDNMFVSLPDTPTRSMGGWGMTRNKTLQLTPVFNIAPVKRFYAKTGTNVGNGEGDGYIQFQLKNLFGGGENLVFDAITGTKTQSSYLLNYTMPLMNSAKDVFEQLFYMNTKQLDWLKCDSKVKGATTRVSMQRGKVSHDISWENCWRVLSNTLSRAMDVLNQLGNDFKSALLYNVKYDTRDNAHLPTRGQYFRVGLEYSGILEACSQRYIKQVVESQRCLKLSDSHSLILTNKAGVLWLMNRAGSHVLDRFFIGGPNDVRSFLLNGLGPKSFNASVGGDLFINGGISLVSRLPKVSPDSNFKLHNFINFGSAVPMDRHNMEKTMALLRQISVGCGVGVLYNHPMARFELNFVLPLVVHERDYVRKGIQYGIGISFL